MIDWGYVTEPYEWGFKSLALSSTCTDAYRILGRTLLKVPQCDGDSMICIFREILSFLRPLKYNKLIAENPGKGTEVVELRPYVRLLQALAHAAIHSENHEVAIITNEEILRIDNEDSTFARELLLINYLKSLGRARRSEPIFIPRNWEHFNALLAAQLPENKEHKLWGGRDKLCFEWVNLVLMFMKGENWEPIARTLEKRCKWVSKLIFDEQRKVPYHGRHCLDGDARRWTEDFYYALLDWPDFVKALHDLLRKKDRKINNEIDRMAPSSSIFSDPEYCSQMIEQGNLLLERGRDLMRKKQYYDAITNLTLAKRCYVDALKPYKRWYEKAPFAILSNRATCCENTGLWWLCRYDTRMTLFMEPSHIRSYERLPKIAKAFFANDLVTELTQLVVRAKSLPNRTQEEWRIIADEAISLISITALGSSRIRPLSDEQRRELKTVGIEDMFTPINVDIETLPQLPWLLK